MKTIEIKDLLKRDLLVVELPEGTADFIVMNTGDRLAVCAFDDVDFCLGVKGISTEYTVLGKADKIKEEDARELVEKSPFNPYCYKQYDSITFNNKKWFKTATESLLSAIETVVFWNVNPLGKEEPKCIRYGTSPERIKNLKWREAESRTFDKSRTLIFVKN